MVAKYLVNARFRKQRMTGVQRYADEILKRIKLPIREITPRHQASGISGHLWEQCILPFKVMDEILWSPCNSGPIYVRNHVVTIHDVAVFDHPEWFSSSFVKLYHFIIPQLCRSSRKILTVSDYSRTRIRQLFNISAKKIDVVYPGVGDNFYPVISSESNLCLVQYGVKKQKYFIVLGSIDPRKNLKLVLDAWEYVSQLIGAEYNLLVVGGGGGVFAKTEYIKKNDKNIIFTGYIDDNDLPSLLSNSLALLYPSLYEGFGLPLLEAMACGTPTVTTRQTSLPEVVGDAGVLIGGKCAKELGDIILRFCKERDFFLEYSRRGLDRKKMFSWDKCAKNIEEIISSL